MSNPEIKVVVCCAHEIRIRESVIQLIKVANDSLSFISSRRNFVMHIDEAHKYIPENRESIKTYNASPIVIDIIGYSGTPDKIWMNNWCKDQSDEIFHKILIRDIEEELSIFRSPEYFGVNRCEFNILEETMSHDELMATDNMSENIPQVVLARSDMIVKGSKFWYNGRYPFDLGDEKLLLTYIDYIIPRMQINPSTFSYHFVPAYTRKATQYQTVELLLKHNPNANIISINGDGSDLYRIRPSDNRSHKIKSGNQLLLRATMEERKLLYEPSKMIEELIKEYPNCPTFVTGFTCVGMSVTLINEGLGNFDSVVMAHQHYSRDKLYQLCRFLFNYMSWAPESKSRIKTTKFYSLTKLVVDTCLEYEKSVERMSSEYAGKTCSLREINGLEPEEPSERELRKIALRSIEPTNERIWKKFKVYDGNDEEEWDKVEKFYLLSQNTGLPTPSKPKLEVVPTRSKPKLMTEENGKQFYHCSTTEKVDKYSVAAINKLEKQSWYSTFQLQSEKLNYARIFVGYENLEDPTEYTIYVKHVQLTNTPETLGILKKYGKNKSSDSSSDTVSETASDTASDTTSDNDI